MEDYSTISNYPLNWPESYPRTRYIERSRFGNHSFGLSRDMLLDELRLLGASNIKLSTNIPLRNDGLPRASFRVPDDKGVAVYFNLSSQNMVLCCDRWDKIEHNIRAIALTIQAMRGMDRWGVSEMLNRMFRGFAALPAPTNDSVSCWNILQIPPSSSIADIKAAYREQIKKVHPDMGGTNEEFHLLTQAYKDATSQVAGTK